jgi:hypothetical protein
LPNLHTGFLSYSQQGSQNHPVSGQMARFGDFARFFFAVIAPFLAPNCLGLPRFGKEDLGTLVIAAVLIAGSTGYR